MYSPGPVRRARLRRRGRHRGRVLRRRQPRDLRHDLDRDRRRVRDLRRPDLPAAHAAHERPRRRPHRAGVVRAGLRGARLPRAARRPARRRRPGRARGPGRVRPRVVPPPAGRAGVAPVARGRRARPATTSRARGSCATCRFTVEPGELVALVGPSGAGKTTTAMLVPRIARRERRRGAASTATTCATSRSTRCATRSAS